MSDEQLESPMAHIRVPEWVEERGRNHVATVYRSAPYTARKSIDAWLGLAYQLDTDQMHHRQDAMRQVLRLDIDQLSDDPFLPELIRGELRKLVDHMDKYPRITQAEGAMAYLDARAVAAKLRRYAMELCTVEWAPSSGSER